MESQVYFRKISKSSLHPIFVFHPFPGSFPTDPSQHQTSTALSLTCGGNRATPPLLRSLCAVSTSTPKPRAEGSSPSAPAKKPAKTLGFRRFPFFMCCIAIWCILVRISGFPTRPYRLHPSPAPKTHPVSPFLAFPGAFFSFLAFCDRKISALVFVHPAA